MYEELKNQDFTDKRLGNILVHSSKNLNGIGDI